MKYVDYVYNIIKLNSEDMDAIYEDYITHMGRSMWFERVDLRKFN